MVTEAWYRRTLRWAQTNLVEIDPARYDDAWWRAHWKRTRVQGAIINAGGIVAYYPSKFPLHHRAVALDGRDLYGEVTAAAREEGLVVVARMDSNRVAEDFYRAHPDWICIDVDGSPIRVADKYYTCINSPYYIEFLPAVMEEIIERSRPDGFTDNSWAGLPRAHICHCRYCRERFFDHSGLDLPRRHDLGNEAYRRWIRWNYARRVELFARNDEVTMRAGGPDCRWAGMVSGDMMHNAMRFVDLPEILDRTAIVMLDHQRRNAVDGFEQNTEAGKRLHDLAGWDKLIPESIPQYQLGQPPFRLASMPPGEVRLWSSSGFAGGIQPWWHHIGASHEDRRQYRTAEPIFRWHEANEDVLVDRQPRADVGVVWSQDNHDFYGRDDAEKRTLNPYRGVVRALDRAGITYLPVYADRLADASERFRVLILPALGALSDAQADAVRAFAAAGGAVMATGETGLVTEDGERRADFAVADLFGVHLAGSRVHGGLDAPSANIETHARHSYLRLSPELRADVYGPSDPTAPVPRGARHPILSGLDEADTIPFGGYLPEVRVDGDVEVLATFIPDFPIFPPETSWMRTPRTDLPGIVAREGANGARLVWLVADIDRCFMREEAFEHGNLIANAVRWMLDGEGCVTLSGGHGFVTACLYEQQGRRILHLNNRLITGRVPGRQHELLPLGPVEVRLRVDGVGADSAELRVTGESVPVRRDGDSLVFSVPQVVDHEVVVVTAG